MWWLLNQRDMVPQEIDKRSLWSKFLSPHWLCDLGQIPAGLWASASSFEDVNDTHVIDQIY
jgi:hypothetical protein